MPFFFRPLRPRRRRRTFGAFVIPTIPGSKTLPIEPAHLTLTPHSINLAYYPISVAHLTLTGHNIDLTRSMVVGTAHLALSAHAMTFPVAMTISPAHLTLAGATVSLAELSVVTRRRPLLIRKTAEAPATYWRGTINNAN